MPERLSKTSKWVIKDPRSSLTRCGAVFNIGRLHLLNSLETLAIRKNLGHLCGDEFYDLLPPKRSSEVLGKTLCPLRLLACPCTITTIARTGNNGDMTSKWAGSNTCTSRGHNYILLDHHRVTLLFFQLLVSTLHQLRPLRIHPLIQTHAHGIHLIHLSVKVCLEVPMRPETLLDVTRPSVLRVELNGFEVVNVLCVEEHVSHRGRLAVQFERVSREHYTFSDDSCRVWMKERSHRHQIWTWEVGVTNVSSVLIAEGDKKATSGPLNLP